nr:MAG TPA: hypothetical protein [Caudoviricetes sp.]
MLYLFHTHNILPGQYYDMPTGEKIMLRAFVDEILERSK